MVDKLHQFVRHVELMRDGVADWAQYPFSIPAVKHLTRLEFSSSVTFFVGENGSGKSTLLEAIARKCGFRGHGGSKGFTNAQRETESELHENLRLVRGARREKSNFFLRAETMYNVSTEIEDLGLTEYGWEKLHEMSHGEGFLWVALNRFRPNGLYVLDEPEAALSPQRQLALMGRMHQLVTQGSQFIIATHSPLLLAYPGATIYSFGTSGIERVAYEDTEHYTITRAFLMNPERMLRTIFQQVDEDD